MINKFEKFYIVEKQYRQQGIAKYTSIVFLSKTKKRALKLIESDKRVPELNNKYEVYYILSKYEQKSSEDSKSIGCNLMQYSNIYYKE